MRKRKQNSANSSKTCPLEACLQLLSGAWTCHILWYLRSKPKRFLELKHEIQNVSAKVLTQRLRDLEKQGVLIRKVFAKPESRIEYSLTKAGHKLGPVLDQIEEVARQITRSNRSPKARPANRSKKIR